MNPLILSVGMPRAGSGWHYNLTHDLIVASGGQDARQIREKYHLGRILTQVNCNIGTLSAQRVLPTLIPALTGNKFVIKAHAGPEPLAQFLIRLGMIRATYICRDPRDAALSAFEYGQRMIKKGRPNFFSQFSTIEEAIYFIGQYIPIAESWLSCEQVLNVRYEDMLQNYDQEAQRLIKFLGIDPNEPGIEEALEKHNPQSESSRAMGTHFVKGKIGRHRQVFTEEQKALCEEVFGSYLEKQGYETGG